MPLFNQASPTENLCDLGKGQRVASAPLGSYLHLEMCQSLVLTVKSTSGQRSSPWSHRLDITQLDKKKKKKSILSNRRLQLEDPWVTCCEISAQTGASSCGFVGYAMKLKWFMWTPGCLVEGGTDRKKTKKQNPNILCNRSPVKSQWLVPSDVSRLCVCQRRCWIPPLHLPFKGQLARCPVVGCTACSMFVRMISEHYGTVHVGRMSIFNTRHAVSCQNQTACEL